MKKIFIDANVLFTAAYSPSGKAAFVIENMGHLIITSNRGKASIFLTDKFRLASSEA